MLHDRHVCDGLSVALICDGTATIWICFSCAVPVSGGGCPMTTNDDVTTDDDVHVSWIGSLEGTEQRPSNGY